MVVAVPVKVNGVVRGVIFDALDMGLFCDKFISTIKVLDTGYAYLYDSKGVLIAHPKKELVLKIKLDDYEWGREIMKKRAGSVDYDFSGQSVQAVFNVSDSLGWGLALAAPLKELNAPVRQMMLNIAILGLVAMAAGIVCMLLVARSIVRPIERATENVSSSSNQTTDAAAQVAQTSQTLAEGASEQASAAEETLTPALKRVAPHVMMMNAATATAIIEPTMTSMRE